MSRFAVRKDGLGWRSIQSSDSVLPEEDYLETDGESPVSNPPPESELIAAASRERDGLLAIATNRIAPLEDAYDAGRATEAEALSLELWKAYRIDLSRIESQEGYPKTILWPSPP